MSEEITSNQDVTTTINRCKRRLELRSMPDGLILEIVKAFPEGKEATEEELMSLFYSEHSLFLEWLTSIYVKGVFGGGSFKDVLAWFVAEIKRVDNADVSLNDVLFVIVNNDTGVHQYNKISVSIARFACDLVGLASKGGTQAITAA